METATQAVRIDLVPVSVWRTFTESEWKIAVELAAAEKVHYVVINDAYVGAMFRPEFLQIYYGGSGSAKSFTKATELLIKAMREPFFRLLFVRKFKDQVRDSQFQLFKDLIKLYGWQAYFHIKDNEMDIRCTLNDNLLLSGGLDDVDKLKSLPELTDIWIEEPIDKKGTVTAADFSELERRVRSPRGSNHLHLTFNPVSKQSWVYRLLFTEDTAYTNAFKLKTTYIDNAFRPAGEEEKYERQRKTNIDQYNIYALGEWGDADDLENRLFQDEAVEDLFHNEFIGRTGTRYLTADIAHGGVDKFVIMVWDGWVVIDVLTLDKSESDVVLLKLKSMMNKWAIPGQRVTFDSQGVGDYLKGQLKSAVPFIGSGTPLAEKNLTDRQKEVARRPHYKNLRAQCYHGIAEKVANAEVYFEYPSHAAREALAQELRATKKLPTPDGGKYQIVPKEDIKDAIGRSPDFADAFSMRYIFELSPAPKKSVRVVRGIGG
jgi:phage terminase large subunit